MTQYSLLNEKCPRCGKHFRPTYPCDEICAALPENMGVTYTLNCGHQSDQLDGRMWCRMCLGTACQVDPTTRNMLRQAMDSLDVYKYHPKGLTKTKDLLREVWHRIHYWTTECPPSTKSKDGSETPPTDES